MNKLLIAAAVGTLALGACKQSGTSVSNNQTQGMTDEAPIANSGMGNMSNSDMAGNAAMLDQQYVQNAAASDMFEIETSRLALEKAASPAIKTYAQMMIDEHGRSSAELNAAAGQAGIAVPTALPREMQIKVDALRGLRRSEFDQRYLAEQRAGHQDTLAKVNAYLATAPAGPLRDHAAKLTGAVQKHLNSLEKIK